jgi:hypothetical protein
MTIIYNFGFLILLIVESRAPTFRNAQRQHKSCHLPLEPVVELRRGKGFEAVGAQKIFTGVSPRPFTTVRLSSLAAARRAPR